MRRISKKSDTAEISQIDKRIMTTFPNFQAYSNEYHGEFPYLSTADSFPQDKWIFAFSISKNSVGEFY